MTRRTHTAAVYYALEQELFEKGEKLYSDMEHRKVFFSRQKYYLGSVKRGERTIHYWWVIADEEMMTIDEGSGGVNISGNLDSPLKRIPQKEMTVEELEQSGEYELPQTMMRELNFLTEMEASVLGPLEYRASDVLLPLLGIKIVPDSDAEFVEFEDVDWGLVRFFCSSRHL